METYAADSSTVGVAVEVPDSVGVVLLVAVAPDRCAAGVVAADLAGVVIVQ